MSKASRVEDSRDEPQCLTQQTLKELADVELREVEVHGRRLDLNRSIEQSTIEGSCVNLRINFYKGTFSYIRRKVHQRTKGLRAGVKFSKWNVLGNRFVIVTIVAAIVAGLLRYVFD